MHAPARRHARRLGGGKCAAVGQGTPAAVSLDGLALHRVEAVGGEARQGAGAAAVVLSRALRLDGAAGGGAERGGGAADGELLCRGVAQEAHCAFIPIFEKRGEGECLVLGQAGSASYRGSLPQPGWSASSCGDPLHPAGCTASCSWPTAGRPALEATHLTHGPGAAGGSSSARPFEGSTAEASRRGPLRQGGGEAARS